MIKDEETGWVEPSITINGQPLSFAEAMTVRVAIATMQLQMSDPATQALVGKVAAGYVACCGSIFSKMLSSG